MRKPGRTRQERIERQKEIARIARIFIKQYKSNKACMDCKVFYPPYVLQFDHRDPATKKYHVAEIVGPISMVMREINKCDLVCANCHAERTMKRRLEIEKLEPAIDYQLGLRL